MKNTLLLICFICIVSWSCEPERCGCENINRSIGILYTDQNGKHLIESLDPAFIHSNIILYYMIDGKPEIYTNIPKGYRPDNPYGYSVIRDTLNPDQKDVIQFGLNDKLVNKSSRTLIEFKGYPMDTIDATFNTDNGMSLESVWINGTRFQSIDETIQLIK